LVEDALEQDARSRALGPDSKLVDAIKAYRRALRGKRRGDVLDALDALTDELCDCTRRNLKRRDLTAEQKRVRDARLGEALSHQAEKHVGRGWRLQFSVCSWHLANAQLSRCLTNHCYPSR
jgi:hypothetical protein